MASAGNHDPTDEDRILEEAAGWCMKIKAGDITEDDPDYLAWLNASDLHADAMMRARIAWGLMGDHAKSPELMRARSDALARTTRAAARRWTPLPLLRRNSGNTFSGPRTAVAAGFAVLIAASLAVLLWPGVHTPEAVTRTYATDIAETRIVTLPDNSRISLDAASRVSVAYTAAERDITLLAGQAFFDVAKDPARPFRVTAGDQTVVAVGTAFNVEIVDRDVVVTLVEGEVVVTDTADTPTQDVGTGDASSGITSASLPVRQKPVKLSAGQQFLAAHDAAPQVDADPNIEKSTAWRQGRVFLDDDSLDVAVARVNRYSRIRIVIADDSLAELEVGGVFNAGDTDAFIGALEAAFPIEARRMSSSLIELHRRT